MSIGRYSILAVLLMAGCTGPQYRIHEGRDEARAITTLSGPAAGDTLDWHGGGRLSLELQRLKTFSSELTDLGEEMSALHRTVGGKKIEFYTMDEHDRIESMLFRYLVCREALWDVASYYGKSHGLFTSGSEQTKALIIAYSAALKVSYTDTKLIVNFIDQPVSIAKLNEGYPNCRIPAGSYDRVFQAVTSVDHLEAMEAAWELFKEQADDPRSGLSKVARSDPEYAAIVRDIRTQRLYSKAQTNRLLDQTSILFPNMENRLRQSKVAALAGGAREAFKSGLGACGSLLGGVTTKLLRSPVAVDVKFKSGELDSMFARAQPGDIFLTMRDGYLSNLFIPGEFKHSITYVGSVAKRRAVGLSKEALTYVPARIQHRTAGHLFESSNADGERADCVEAVAEGVIFSSLDHLTRIALNRVLILRPVLTPEERVHQLATVFSRLDDSYDFKFNFIDDRHLCCTELIYRSLHNRGTISFSLVKRMGLPTLSADDIIRTHFSALDAGRPTFEVIALAEEDPNGSDHAGRVLTAAAAEQRLREIMNIPAPPADGDVTHLPHPAGGLADHDPTLPRLAALLPARASVSHPFININ